MAASARTPAALRELGTVLGVATRGRGAGGLRRAGAGRRPDEARRPARGGAAPGLLRPGPEGLDTGLKGSINVEILDLVGARNVAEGAGAGGLATVSAEQVLAWNPDVVLTLDPGFYASVGKSPLWRQVKAVREGRVYLAPSLPFGWFDQPPGLNRLIGVRWLGRVLYPAQFPEDLRCRDQGLLQPLLPCRAEPGAARPPAGAGDAPGRNDPGFRSARHRRSGAGRWWWPSWQRRRSGRWR